MKLHVFDGPMSGKEIPIGEFPFTIGRSGNAADVGFSTDTRMSRCHCRLGIHDDTLWIEDLKSSNGTWVDARAVTERTTLQRRQRFTVGDTTLCLLADDEEAPISSSASNWTSLDLATGAIEPEDEDESFRTRPFALRSLGFDLDQNRKGDTHTQADLANPPDLSAPGSDPDSAEIQFLRRHLAVLQGLAAQLTRTIDLEQILGAAADAIITACPGARVVVLLPASDGQLLPMLTRPENRAKEALVLSRTIVDRAVRDRLTVLIEDTQLDESLVGHASIQCAAIRSAICVPLLIVDSVRAVLYIDAGVPRAFTSAETETVVTVGNQTALALSNAGQSERLLEVSERLRDAKHKQENLLAAFRGMARAGV